MEKIILLGSDPELMGIDLSTGVIGSFAGKLGADKWNKKYVTDDVRIQEDNVMIEFDINPHGTFEDFNKNMIDGVDICKQQAAEVGMDIALGVCSHTFSPQELASFHESAFVFGCEPDFNALTGMRNPKPASADPGLRTAGGHIHIGYDGFTTVTDSNQKVMGVMCDYFLGLPSLLLDKDDKRRELYGKAGSCRFKPYGIEYRTLSNFWTTEEKLRRWAWDQAMKATKLIEEGFMELVNTVSPAEVQRIINENDKRAAEQVIIRLNIQ